MRRGRVPSGSDQSSHIATVDDINQVVGIGGLSVGNDNSTAVLAGMVSSFELQGAHTHSEQLRATGSTHTQ